MKPTRVLFLIKNQGPYYVYEPVPPPRGWGNGPSGIHQSVSFIIGMLQELGIEAKCEILQDGNSVDGAVTKYEPTHVVIEALWITPDKLAQLTKLHPAVRWNVRLHSELPFLATEGVAMQWLFAYLKLPHVTISDNSQRGCLDFQKILQVPVIFTPNYYPVGPIAPRKGLPSDQVVDVACLGAIRPLKNQFTQAVAAIDWATVTKQTIRYHINADRIEGGWSSDNILKNIRNLFANRSPHVLVEHPWLPPADFMALVRLMDIGLQVSMSETFNIVSADFTVSNVPLVVSPEVIWVGNSFKANPNSTTDIVDKMNVAWAGRLTGLQQQNYNGLVQFDIASSQAWPNALNAMM